MTVLATKAITIRQPWVGAIFAPAGRTPKLVENRSRAFSHRGPLLIHAGQALADGEAFTMVQELTAERVPVLDPFVSGVRWAVGAIVGVVDLVSVHDATECDLQCSPWALPRQKHHVLERPRLLTRPVQAFGKQGLWTPDELVLEQVRAAMPPGGGR